MKQIRIIQLKIVNPLIYTYGIHEYKTPGSAGVDLVACIDEPLILKPHSHLLIGSGIAVNIEDPNLVAVVSSRSGLYFKNQVRVGQGTGIIDSDYHGEIGVLLANDGITDYTIKPGERIAQLLFMPVEQVKFNIVEEFDITTIRGTGGFGHTGRD